MKLLCGVVRCVGRNEVEVGSSDLVFDGVPVGACEVVEGALYGYSSCGANVEDGVDDVVVGNWW